MGKFTLACSVDGAVSKPTGPFDFATTCHGESLLNVNYEATKLTVDHDRPGLWKYIDWLPVREQNDYVYGPVTYKSKGLAKELGLNNLWISLNGYYPDMRAYYKSCTFKELHAVMTMQYARENGIEKLVLASAGNTAVAFAYIAELLQFPMVCIVPEKCMCGVNIPNMVMNHARIVMLDDGDYSDGLDIARRLCKVKDYVYEGGCRNISRRAGLGVPYIDAVVTIGQIPDHYFQAVGSGTGGVASWEANWQFINDGSYGSHQTRLHLAQNAPMTPMVSAWNAGRNYIDMDKDIPKIDNILDMIYAPVLSTKYPAYEIRGGVYDALKATKGEMYAVTNDEAFDMAPFFKKLEGPDLLPASCVATAALRQAVRDKKVKPDDVILLNLTGVGKEQRHMDLAIMQINPVATIHKNITDSELEALNV